MCYRCGIPTCSNPDFCQSAQPYCDQCANETRCVDKLDFQCSIYHFNTTAPTRLLNLGFGNGANLEAIIEKIDQLLGTSFNIPFTPVDTLTVKWTAGGTAGHSPKADVAISAISGNTLIIEEDGLYSAGANPNYKVKVDATAPPRYLEDAVYGGTDGCVSITTEVVDEQLLLLPTIEIPCLINRLCDDLAASSADHAENALTQCILYNISQSSAGDDLATITVGAICASTPLKEELAGCLGGYFSGTTDAENGLHVDTGVVKMGGPLTEDTIIPSGGFKLSFTDAPILSLGSSTPSGAADLEVLSDATRDTGISSHKDLTFPYSGGKSASGGEIEIVGGVQTQVADGDFGGIAGQVWFNATGTVNLAGGDINGYAGVSGTFVKSGNSDLTNGNPSAGFFITGLSGSGNISDLSSVRIGATLVPPSGRYGGAFTGTVTNFYSLFIEDIAASAYGADITNKYAIYQKGTTDSSIFFGPVKNAGGTTQFTSDLRVKENVNPYTRGLTEIEQINPRTFNYTYNKVKTVTGIIAQELETVIPEAVEKGHFMLPSGETFEDFRMIDQNVLFYTMLNAIKELSAKVKALENK